MKEGWEIKKLSQVCEKITDGTHQTPKYFENGYTFLSSGNVTSGFINWEKIKYIDEGQHIEMQKRVSPKLNDILLAKNGTTGIAAIVDRDIPFDIYVSLALLRPTEKLSPSYLLHFVNSPLAKAQFNKRLKGIGVPNLHLEEIREVEIIYPKSLPEQLRIVSLLDECFSSIDQAKANLTKNLNNAKELFQSELNQIFSQKGEGWIEKKLNQVSEVKDGTHDSPRYISKGIPFVTQKNIKEDGLTFENTKFITQTDHDKFYKRSNVAYGDILISMIGANRGMACIVNDERIFSIKNVGLFKASKNINQQYLLYYLKSSITSNYVKSFSKGGAQEFIGLTELRNIPVIIAPSIEQQSIVSRLDSLSSQTKKLESIYQQKLTELEDLKKSILQKAFSGELKSIETETLI